MELYGDYHTHTVFSHGSGTVEENVKAAARLGLKQIAITDHGLSHIAFGLRKGKIKRLKEEIRVLREKYEIGILMGVEANITGLDGQIDLTDEEFSEFDIVLCGYHKFVWPKTVNDYFNFFTPNYFYDTFRQKAPERVVRANTQALINNISRYNVDVITHINYGMRVDCKEVAKACAKYGTLIEINGKRITYSDGEMNEMLDTGVNFIVNSDAHSPDRVGEVNRCFELINRLNIPESRIANFGKMPRFRLQTYKNGGDKL